MNKKSFILTILFFSSIFTSNMSCMENAITPSLKVYNELLKKYLSLPYNKRPDELFKEILKLINPAICFELYDESYKYCKNFAIFIFSLPFLTLATVYSIHKAKYLLIKYFNEYKKYKKIKEIEEFQKEALLLEKNNKIHLDIIKYIIFNFAENNEAIQEKYNQIFNKNDRTAQNELNVIRNIVNVHGGNIITVANVYVSLSAIISLISKYMSNKSYKEFNELYSEILKRYHQFI